MTQLVVRPMQWDQLQDMEDMDHALDETDAACLDALREVLERHGKLDRFGVNLLHKHFELEKDECLLETVDTENRVLVVRPIARSNLPAAVQTQWSLANRDPLQWCERYCHYSGGTHHGGHQLHIQKQD